ncbi:MAG: L-2-hydroxyglutarate oxidase, partial [Lentisphaerota bacterium]
TEVTKAYARVAQAAGASIQLGARLMDVRRERGSLRLSTPRGDFQVRFLINCAGLQSDRVARLCGVEPGLRIVPFRGEYYSVARARRSLIRNLIYPVPDPRFPFLGVHFTRRIHGEVEAGPNAVLAFKREGYSKFSFSPRDAFDTLAYGGFVRMAARFWKTGLGEFYRSFNKDAFVRALQRLVPAIRAEDLEPGGAGVRAQALGPDGALIDDFCIREAGQMIHVLNAPSPAATASISIGRTIAEMAAARMPASGAAP